MNRQQRRAHLLRSLQAMLEESPDGARLPPERALAEQFGVARETLRRALRTLQGEGLLQRRRGSGTYAAGHAWLKPLVLRSFSQDMRERGLLPSSRLLSCRTVRADAKAALGLKLAPGSVVIELRRLRLASGEPMALEQVLLPAARLPGFEASVLESGSLYDLMARHWGIQVRNASQEILATVVNEEEAMLLDVAPFSPALLVARQVYATTGDIVELGKSLYRADRYRFEVNVGRADARPVAPS